MGITASLVDFKTNETLNLFNFDHQFSPTDRVHASVRLQGEQDGLRKFKLG